MPGVIPHPQPKMNKPPFGGFFIFRLRVLAMRDAFARRVMGFDTTPGPFSHIPVLHGTGASLHNERISNETALAACFWVAVSLPLNLMLSGSPLFRWSSMTNSRDSDHIRLRSIRTKYLARLRAELSGWHVQVL